MIPEGNIFRTEKDSLEKTIGLEHILSTEKNKTPLISKKTPQHVWPSMYNCAIVEVPVEAHHPDGWLDMARMELYGVVLFQSFSAVHFVWDTSLTVCLA